MDWQTQFKVNYVMKRDAIVASIHLSRGKIEAARINVSQALLFVTIVALVPSILMMAYPSGTARLLGASEYLTPLVREYLLWFIPSLLFQMLCSVRLFIIRLVGAPKLAMLCNVMAAFISVVLGYQCSIGSSALLTEATMAILMFVGNHVFMKYLGDNGVGAFGIACYYTPFVFMVGNAIAQSAQPIISYNFGLVYRNRVKATERIALLTAIVCGVVLTAAFSLFPDILVGLFINTENPAAKIAIDGFPYFSAAFVFFIFNITVIGYYQSLEKMRHATVLELLRGFIFLIPSFILLPKIIGTHGIWLALCFFRIIDNIHNSHYIRDGNTEKTCAYASGRK